MIAKSVMVTNTHDSLLSIVQITRQTFLHVLVLKENIPTWLKVCATILLIR